VKKAAGEIIAELTDELSTSKPPSRHLPPSRYEEGYLLSSLASFYDKGLITDVLSLVKGARRPTSTAARPTVNRAWACWRPRYTGRACSATCATNKMYQQGREVLTADGRPAGKAACTIARAIRNKSGFGLEAATRRG